MEGLEEGKGSGVCEGAGRVARWVSWGRRIKRADKRGKGRDEWVVVKSVVEDIYNTW